MQKSDIRREREERRRQEYRRLILQAAERVVVEKGTSAMTMDDVAREAAFSKATLYHYFRGKGELVFEVLENFFEEMNQELARIKTLKIGAADKLKRGIRFYLQSNQEKRNISRMLMMDRSFVEKMRILVVNEKDSVSKKDRQFIDRLKAKRREILDGVADILREGMASGEFRRVDVENAVTFLEAILWGYCQIRFWRDKTYSVRDATNFIHALMLEGFKGKDEIGKGDR
ncbi:MAG: TetR/AcrR family transcriptional regulator [Clostridiales bacterium]|nr:TetR/AcrR family transcriptional regulator [Clostridiales bacterium]